ncbi:MAG: tRNA nucleotidyltransferase/poly(A) polymerase family protein [Candidatus Yanofskybacteria bacterium GW2011_GWC2_41_9]|uniref:tRNA nucleotidyltransferase/poly(A) polymerase family protein n=1 Tax=Candidatus Yanofskybacteria bacterium GW2011_GWC2_41_9 TaxID=1619029 RepID=A0A0G0XPV6_9BACT|nr:MAG: tRNA nucleotidyltransferase/poly(A) polymerase family protein [Candidatus Yanofskybacteria bacterium GW2011_GWC2_41_9]
MTIPKEVRETIKALNDAGFEAYAVGGCVRDFILGREPYDWDITTNAKPEEIGKLFKKSIYENEFGTVAINTESADPKLKIIEITTYRVEEKYTDKRHPDSVKFTKKLEDDLSRRDFTVNAMALEIQNSKFKIQNDNSKFKIVDPFGGQDDMEIRMKDSTKTRFA